MLALAHATLTRTQPVTWNNNTLLYNDSHLDYLACNIWSLSLLLYVSNNFQ